MSSWSSSLPELAEPGADSFDATEVEDAVREGYRVGFAAGEADGHAAATQTAREQAAAALADDRRQAAAVLLALRDELHRVTATEAAIRAEFEAAVVDAAVTLARAILDRELAVEDDPGLDALRRAMAVAPTGPDSAVVRFHPRDHARLGNLEDLALGRELTVVADQSVAPGGCRVEIGATTIDADVDAALARVREALSC